MAMVAAQRRDWRETVAAAGDFALLGVGVTLAAMPLLTIGAAVATGSYATRQWCVDRAMPPWRELARRFVSWLLPGITVTLIFMIASGLLALDLALLAFDVVPGGPVVLVVTAVAACWFAVVAALAVVQFGRQDEPRWRTAAGWAIRASTRAPHRAIVVLLVCLLAGVLAALVPMAAPLFVGYCLLAMHAVAGRLLPDEFGEPIERG